MWGIETSESQAWEGSISETDFAALLEPLRDIRVPPYPPEGVAVIDGAIYGFEVVLGPARFGYQWHTIPPKGWEPLADWLGNTIQALRQLTGTPAFR